MVPYTLKYLRDCRRRICSYQTDVIAHVHCR